MAINYNLDNRLSLLNTLLGEYQSWFVAVTQACFYDGNGPDMPQGLLEWLESIAIEEFNIDGQYVPQREEAKQKHKQLSKAAEALGKQPQADQYAEFSALFREFMSQLQGVCHNIVLEEWGLDVLTGLKNNTMFKSDLAIEMERLAREGHPFCLGLARIDDFSKIEEKLGLEQANGAIKTIATLVQASLRSYDDAYRVSRGHFILCLKQSDLMGGQKALERLRDLMEEGKASYDVDGMKTLLSLSCCVAAPLAGDDIDDLLDNLYLDLDEQIKDHGAVLTYQEMSPLQRFIQKEKE